MNNDAIHVCGTICVALASFSHQGADWAGSPTGAAAADRILSATEAVLVAGADDARVQLGELAVTIDTASAPPARVEDRAVVVQLACRRTTLAFTTLGAGQAFDDSRGADAVGAHVRDAGIIVLAAAVAMVRARSDATAFGAELVLGTTPWTDILTDSHSPVPARCTEGHGRQCSPEQCPAIGGGGESFGKEIEPVLRHRHP